MEGDEIRVAFLYDEGAEGETKGNVVEGVWFLLLVAGEYC